MEIKNQANLSKSINRLANNNNPTDMHTGWLGNGQGVVLVPNSTNGTEVYVRIMGQSGVKIAFNSVVPNADNLPVEIGYYPSNPVKLQIIRQLSYFPSLNVSNVPSLGGHHQQHEYGGADMVFISKRQYMPFRLNAYGFLVVVSPDYIYTNNQWNLFYPTGITDLLGLVPTSGSRYMLVSVDTDGLTTDFTTGSVSMSLSLTDIPGLPYGNAPVAAVKLYSGQTGIYEYTDILDLRGNPFIGISGSYGSGTGTYGDMYRSTYDPGHTGIVVNSDKLDGHHWSEITGSSGGGNVYGSPSVTNGHMAGFDTDGYHIKDIGAIPAGTASDGWVSAPTLTYSSADAPNYIVTCTGDQTGVISPGMRIKLIDSSVIKYFIVMSVSYTSSTAILLYGGTDYTLSGGAITSPYYSVAKAPFGFPLSPSKWTVEVTSVTQYSQSNPTISVYYNLGTTQITIPIGVWNIILKGRAYANKTGNGAIDIQTTLSTTNNSETDTDFTYREDVQNSSSVTSQFFVNKILVLTTKTTYYLLTNQNTGTINNIYNLNDQSKLSIRAVCAYL
jgi:hypothetical protein